ncbi:hypothetical protein MLD38_008822 [Melastoma candidum]|uniref:Uncharacterized protein n=1 Tax=Melastoma candidum TaxID=119954 RepID=A0ACB9RX01_9MYRT|nr:hypothetical protein MLD38_008822 [Melastoma candidum]
MEDQVAMFIGGLKKETRRMLIVLEPRTLQKAISLGKALSGDEEVVTGGSRDTLAKGGRWDPSSNFRGQSMAPSNRGPFRGSGDNKLIEGNFRQSTSFVSRSQAYQPPHKRLTAAEMADKRQRGVCFWCDGKFTYGHQCPNKRSFAITLEPDEPEETEDEVVQQQDPVTEEEKEETPRVSLYALHGISLNSQNRSMKVVRHYKRMRLVILIDSGSTHNFLDPKIAKQTGLLFVVLLVFGYFVRTFEGSASSRLVGDVSRHQLVSELVPTLSGCTKGGAGR